MPHDVFISHSARDRAVAESVCAALEESGVQCWIAPRDVRPGRSFPGEITRGIQESKVMVLIVSGASNSSQQVLREVQLAVESDLHILQLRLEDLALSDDLKYFLGTPDWLDASHPPFEQHLKRLLAATRELLGQPPPPSASELAAAKAPGPANPVAPAQGPGRAEASPLRQSALATPSPSSARTPLLFGLVGLVVAAVIFAGAWAGWRLLQAAKDRLSATKEKNTLQAAPRSPQPMAVADAERDYELGLQYFRGGGSVAIDWKQALRCFIRAAKHELPEAEAETARLCQTKNLYDFGDALPSTPPEEWANRAWRHGLEARAERSHRAAYEVAELYHAGLGVTQDHAKARQWYELAAAQGNTDAKRALGFYYFSGTGVTKDLTKARSYLEEAAAADNASARLLLALVCFLAGTKEDDAKGIEWLKKAAAQGSASAWEQLAAQYEQGKRIEKDIAESMKLRRQAAGQGLYFSMNELAKRYENGTDLPKDLGEAERLYKKLDAAGYPKAKEGLERVRALSQSSPASR